jgi:hypothetical protein
VVRLRAVDLLVEVVLRHRVDVRGHVDGEHARLFLDAGAECDGRDTTCGQGHGDRDYEEKYPQKTTAHRCKDVMNVQVWGLPAGAPGVTLPAGCAVSPSCSPHSSRRPP